MQQDPENDTDPTFDALHADYGRCLHQLQAQDDQFWRRTAFRTAFSMFEAMNAVLKEKALEAVCSGDKKSWSVTRIQLLGDSDYRILKNGKLEIEPLRKPFVNYTAFILRCLAEGTNSDPTFFMDNGWNEFQKSTQVRHRLTHPKKNTDMTISDAELESLFEAVRWYGNSTVAAMIGPAPEPPRE